MRTCFPTHLDKELRAAGFRGSEGRMLAKPKVRVGPFSKSRLQTPSQSRHRAPRLWRVGRAEGAAETKKNYPITQPICSPPVPVEGEQISARSPWLQRCCTPRARTPCPPITPCIPITPCPPITPQTLLLSRRSLILAEK